MFGFSWVIDEKLAGLGRPGALARALEADLQDLRAEGVRALVSLTEEPLPGEAVQAAGLTALHLPVPDMEPPTGADIDRFVEFTSASLRAGRPVAVHCAMGRGRTGTMLACYLVHTGCDPAGAIRQVRRQRPGSIETRGQERAVFDYARVLAEAAR